VTDFGAQVRAAIQQVRERTPRECDAWCETVRDSGIDGVLHSEACTCDWQARVNARLAACVETGFAAAYPGGLNAVAADDLIGGAFTKPNVFQAAREAGLAAFLAAAAQKETTK